MPAWTQIRSKLAVATRVGEPSDVLEALRRDLRAARAEDYLRTLIAAEPPLTDGQRAALVEILADAA
jgi:hypothetical protein